MATECDVVTETTADLELLDETVGLIAEKFLRNLTLTKLALKS
ncbi:MAG: hypothetical protein OXO49_02025 [Gammaproteobacteria bacterium]|nr:hypothetical protein [Gammaproteobacteria bacterium]MDE0251281.1 hypothetical protein [Gammaproteobacteria bacterium]MDE0402034.1 hypothetical protein [Gammaproteobacteria bacterium]